MSKELAKKLLIDNDFIEDLEDSTGTERHEISFQITEEIIIEAMIKFARTMCEEQKQICASEANEIDGYLYDRILKLKNVSDL